jgi:CheY-like chemotaxis protein
MTGNRPLILIVDDDYDFLEINRYILETAGYRVVTATNPTEAAERVDLETPNLVITDLMMTSVDAGFTLAAQLRGDPRTANVPIIISTSVSSQLGLNFRPETPEDLKKMNVDAYFDKPIAADALLAKVSELLSHAG